MESKEDNDEEFMAMLDRQTQDIREYLERVKLQESNETDN